MISNIIKKTITDIVDSDKELRYCLVIIKIIKKTVGFYAETQVGNKNFEERGDLYEMDAKIFINTCTHR